MNRKAHPMRASAAALLALIASICLGEEAPLTISETAGLAAGEAPGIARARADVEAAEARHRAARSLLGPSLAMDAGLLATNDPVGVFSYTLKQERFSLVEFAASDPNHPPITQNWAAAIAAGWSLDLFGSARGEARAAGKATEAAARTASRTRDTLVFQALSAFAAAWRAEEANTLLSARRADAEKDVSLARSLQESGLTTAADPARAEAALADVEAQVAAEQSAKATARAALAALIGRQAAERPIVGLPEPRPMPQANSAVRDDVAAAELAFHAAQDSVKAARSSRFPALVLSARYDLNAPRPGSRWGDSASFFGGFHVPIFASGAVDARISEALASERGAEAAAREAKQEQDRQIAAARAAMTAASSRVAAFGEAEKAAARARQIQQARYEEGAARLSDLLDARAAELSARLGAAAARSELTISEARLRLALGLPPEGEEN
ncbi:MAG TPA: TolC family protein [Thermoanaerobaculia bacterium]